MAFPSLPTPESNPNPRLSFEDNSEQQHTRQPGSDFDPCANALANAKITSPFYLYNHDSPRPSHDSKPRAPVNISVRDLEAGDLTPTITQEKEKSGSIDSSKVGLWSPWSRRRNNRCRTTKQLSWFKQLLPWQRLLIKLVSGLILVGIIVGVAVGVSIRVNGSVYKGINQTAEIGGD